MKKTENNKKAQNYLAARGYDYDRLTLEQKQIMNNYVRSKGLLTYSLLMLFISFLALSFAVYKGSSKTDTRFINSRDVIFYAVVAENYERILEPDDVRRIADDIVETNKVNGVRMGTSFFLLAVIVTAVVQQRDKKKTIEAFFPDKNKTDPES